MSRVILIGASTGGPAHIEKILSSLAEPLHCIIIIAQHMGSEFLPSFVKRLALKTNHTIELVADQMTLQRGNIYVANHHCDLIQKEFSIELKVTQTSTAPYNPEINYLFHSATKLLPKHQILATLLTGIGDDGVNGCKELAKLGASCLAESQKTAIVYGIPARAKERIPTIEVMDLDDIITKIKNFGET